MAFAKIDRLRVQPPFCRDPWPVFHRAENPPQALRDAESAFPSALPPVGQSSARLTAEEFDFSSFPLRRGADPLRNFAGVRKGDEAVPSLAQAGEPSVRPFSDRSIPCIRGIFFGRYTEITPQPDDCRFFQHRFHLTHAERLDFLRRGAE